MFAAGAGGAAALYGNLGVALPILKMGGSMMIAFAFYAWRIGWAFALGFIILIFIHEMGHVVAARTMGLKVSLPVFIPFAGALILMREIPRNAWIEAIVGIGGPIFGSMGAVAAASCYYLLPGHHQIYLGLGYFGFFINLFNLTPIVPLDGGRIVSAITPWLWLMGACILLPYLVYIAIIGDVLTRVIVGFILYIVYRNFYRVLALFRGGRGPEGARYYECTPVQRWTMGILYFGLASGLFLGMGFIKNLLPPGSL